MRTSRGLLLLILNLVWGVWMVGCASTHVQENVHEKGRKGLQLEAYPRVLLSPGIVRLRGWIPYEEEGVECPGVTWIFGDGSTSSREAACKGEIRGHFETSHTFRGRGRFQVHLFLWKGGKVVERASVMVQVGVSDDPLL